jgi:hypothetical protein
LRIKGNASGDWGGLSFEKEKRTMPTAQNNRALLLTLMMLVTGGTGSFAQNLSWPAEAIQDTKVTVKHWEPMSYPSLPHLASLQSIVVVGVTLGDDGRVVEASPLSGHELFFKDVVNNATKWTFEPNGGRRAIIVYNFEIQTGSHGCHGSCSAWIYFRPPNFITIKVPYRIPDVSSRPSL